MKEKKSYDQQTIYINDFWILIKFYIVALWLQIFMIEFQVENIPISVYTSLPRVPSFSTTYQPAFSINTLLVFMIIKLHFKIF